MGVKLRAVGHRLLAVGGGQCSVGFGLRAVPWAVGGNRGRQAMINGCSFRTNFAI